MGDHVNPSHSRVDTTDNRGTNVFRVFFEYMASAILYTTLRQTVIAFVSVSSLSSLLNTITVSYKRHVLSKYATETNSPSCVTLSNDS